MIVTNRITKIITVGSLLLGLHSPSLAQTIPIELSWFGKEPDRVSLQTVGGMTGLINDRANKKFLGELEIDGQSFITKTILVSYDNNNYPFYLKVSKFTKKIEIPLVLNPPKSCIGRHAQKVAQKVDNLPDALASVLLANHLLSIVSPNDCGPHLTPEVKKAKYDRTVQLAQYSLGLFQTSPELRSQYLASVREASKRQAEAQVVEYEKQLVSLEAVRLRTAREEAQKGKDFRQAAQINDVMIERARSTRQLETAYKDEGVTIRQLEKDGAFLETRAANIEARSQSDF